MVAFLLYRLLNSLLNKALNLKKELERQSQTSPNMAGATTRYAVVTGGNKGIGFAICRQLATKGIVTVLTARDEKRGLEAAQQLQKSGLGDRIVFHQVDVANRTSIAALADFIKSKFGKLDILVNNAGVSGTKSDPDAFKAAMDKSMKTGHVDWSTAVEPETYERSEECVRINYYGAKTMCEALLPLLQLSDSPRIVNVASSMGQLKNVTNPWAKQVLSDAQNLTQERVDEVLNQYLKDFKDGLVSARGWPAMFSPYILSKAALIAYTRILANKYPSFCVNALCPGFVRTDNNFKTGKLTPDEGAESVVRLALLPNGSPSGLFYYRTGQAPY